MSEPPSESMNKGWGWPLNSKVSHYFVNGRSLCRRWLFLGKPTDEQRTTATAGPDDCRSCHAKAKALKE